MTWPELKDYLDKKLTEEQKRTNLWYIGISSPNENNIEIDIDDNCGLIIRKRYGTGESK